MNMQHLDPEKQLSYIYRTLDDASRESIDAHLAICPDCRTNMAEHERVQTEISLEIGASLNGINPSGRMTFAAISEQIQPPALWKERLGGLTATTPLAFAVAGLLLAVFGLWQKIPVLPLSNSSPQAGTYPTLACFFFMMASVQEFDRSFSFRPRLLILALVAGILWLGSAIIGLLNIIIIRDLTIMVVVALGGSAAEAAPVVIISIMIAVMAYIGFVIGGADYHFRNLGQAGSWKLFLITLLGQLFLLILPYLLAPYLAV